jgi:predicted transcriptional regulator
MFYTYTMPNKTGFIGLVIEGELKEKLVYLSKKERRTQTALLEQALRNFFTSKKLILKG